MNTYDRNTDIQEIPLQSPFFRDKVKRFLEANGLRMESLDSYYAVMDEEGTMLAGAGIAGSVLKCLAVSPELRSEGLLVPLVSRIMSEHPSPSLRVFTKPEYQAVFESLGFHLLASAPLAILLEKGRGLEQYCDYLRQAALPGRCGVVVMNANPFTLGHRYLLEQASAQVDHLFVIPVQEDCSDFPYAERLAMIRAGAPDGVTVLEGSDYVISATTFPTYFLKDLSQAAETHMQLDLNLFDRWIAPALGVSVRFVGAEPLDALTNRYNQLITNPFIVPRLEKDAVPVSASRVRHALALGRLEEASALCPASTLPYLLAALAQRALLTELDTELKPGLVCPSSCGAHSDMDYETMQAGIHALRPYWSRMVLAATASELRQVGMEAEEAMMKATHGVNTHRGAIFCLGLALKAASGNPRDVQNRLRVIAQEVLADQKVSPEAVRGARAMAAEGYRELFENWLPFYETALTEGADAELKTLLRIMSTLDDSCVEHRVGAERAKKVKEEAAAVLRALDGVPEMCKRYAAERISPGGAADMLALTILIHSILS